MSDHRAAAAPSAALPCVTRQLRDGSSGSVSSGSPSGRLSHLRTALLKPTDGNSNPQSTQRFAYHRESQHPEAKRGLRYPRALHPLWFPYIKAQLPQENSPCWNEANPRAKGNGRAVIFHFISPPPTRNRLFPFAKGLLLLTDPLSFESFSDAGWLQQPPRGAGKGQSCPLML